MLYIVFYYEKYEDVNSWKSEPKSIIIKAKDIAHAKSKFKMCYPGCVLLSTIPKQKEIRV